MLAGDQNSAPSYLLGPSWPGEKYPDKRPSWWYTNTLARVGTKVKSWGFLGWQSYLGSLPTRPLMHKPNDHLPGVASHLSNTPVKAVKIEPQYPVSWERVYVGGGVFAFFSLLLWLLQVNVIKFRGLIMQKPTIWSFCNFQGLLPNPSPV